MLEIFNYWQVNLLLAVILFVVYYQIYRLIAQEVKDTSSMPIIIGIIGSGVFIVLTPFFEMKFSNDWRIYGLLTIAGIFYALNDVLKAKSFKYLDVSVIAIFSQLSKVFLMIYGIVIFKETLTVQGLIGAALIISGGVILSSKKKKFKINRYAWLIIGASIAFATSLTIDVSISTQFNIAFYLLIVYLIPALIIFVLGNKKIVNIKKDFAVNSKSKKLFLLAGLCSSLGMLFYLIALRQGQVSIIAPLSSVTVLLNVLAGYIFLKERKDPVKRVIAAILVIGGIFLLV